MDALVLSRDKGAKDNIGCLGGEPCQDCGEAGPFV